MVAATVSVRMVVPPSHHYNACTGVRAYRSLEVFVPRLAGEVFDQLTQSYKVISPPTVFCNNDHATLETLDSIFGVPYAEIT